mmetsp:Transcript_22589/g.57416  ORF Transcript_22589/g.57416 Transcript_22589/m.57416 type:complete len:282 (+) Transcript_22589:2383-3228(+)
MPAGWPGRGAEPAWPPPLPPLLLGLAPTGPAAPLLLPASAPLPSPPTAGGTAPLTSAPLLPTIAAGSPLPVPLLGDRLEPPRPTLPRMPLPLLPRLWPLTPRASDVGASPLSPLLLPRRPEPNSRPSLSSLREFTTSSSSTTAACASPPPPPPRLGGPLCSRASACSRASTSMRLSLLLVPAPAGRVVGARATSSSSSSSSPSSPSAPWSYSSYSSSSPRPPRLARREPASQAIPPSSSSSILASASSMSSSPSARSPSSLRGGVAAGPALANWPLMRGRA